MRGWFVRIGRALMPSDEASESVVAKMAPGECAEFRVMRPRSSQMHRMFFGMARVIGSNQDPPRDEDSIVAELKVRAGHFDVFLVDGHEVRVPKSIAFDRLTHDEWMKIWPSLEQAISITFGEEYIAEMDRIG